MRKSVSCWFCWNVESYSNEFARPCQLFIQLLQFYLLVNVSRFLSICSSQHFPPYWLHLWILLHWPIHSFDTFYGISVHKLNRISSSKCFDIKFSTSFCWCCQLCRLFFYKSATICPLSAYHVGSDTVIMQPKGPLEEDLLYHHSFLCYVPSKIFIRIIIYLFYITLHLQPKVFSYSQRCNNYSIFLLFASQAHIELNPIVHKPRV